MRTSTTIFRFAGSTLAGLLLLFCGTVPIRAAVPPDPEDSISQAIEKARNLARSSPVLLKASTPDVPPKRVLAVDLPAVAAPKLNVLDGGRRLENTNLYQIQQPSVLHSSKDFQGDVDYAREQRLNKEFGFAEQTLQKLMAADAPAEIHRKAMMELALLAQDQTNVTRALQIFSQYTKRFPDDERLPEIYLMQGLLYRETGALNLAMNRFYLVLSSAVQLKLEEIAYYQRLVLQAKAEIADTLVIQGKVDEAAETYSRLLALSTDQLNRPLIHSKLIRCYFQVGRKTEAVTEGEQFLLKYPDAAEMAEVRFMVAGIYKQTNRNTEATRHTLKLLQSQQAAAGSSPGLWAYWQQRTGNDIANQLYRDGDYMNALSVYGSISTLGTNAGWQLPAMYQMGLIYERLAQTQKASEIYARIVDREKTASPQGDNAVASVIEMARWRGDYLKWIEKSAIDRELLRVGATTNTAASL